MILVEGLDNTGKTTLVERLLDDFPVLEYRPSIGNKHDREQIRKQAAEEAWIQMPHVLGDRSRIISEYIYNPVLKRRPIAYPMDEYMEMLGGFARGHHLIIHCYRSVARIIDTYNDQDQLAGVRQNLAEIASRYDQVMHMLRFLFAVADSNSEICTYTFEPNKDRPDPYTTVLQYVRRYLREVS